MIYFEKSLSASKGTVDEPYSLNNIGKVYVNRMEFAKAIQFQKRAYEISKQFEEKNDILHYKKGISKEIIRILSAYFKVSQEAFNRAYKLKSEYNSHLKNASVMNTRKSLVMVRR